jgi:hypothetical protein
VSVLTIGRGRAIVRKVGADDWRVLAMSPAGVLAVMSWSSWSLAQVYADGVTRRWAAS